MRLDAERYSCCITLDQHNLGSVRHSLSEDAVFFRRKAMKGRLYFATKAQKEGKIMIKTHPCAQIFCCDMCGFEQVLFFLFIRQLPVWTCIWLVLHRKYVTTGWR